MRGAGAATLADRRQNYFFFSAGAFSPGLAAPFSGTAAAAPLTGAFSPGLAAPFSPGLASAFFALGRRSTFFAFFFLLFDHFDVAGGHRLAFRNRSRFFLFRARQGDGDDRNVLVAENLDPGGRFDFAEVDGLAEFEMAHVHDHLLGQIPGQGAHFQFEDHVLEHAAAVFHAGRFADGFQRHQDDHFFVFGHFMEIHVQHVAFERMVLDFLHQREAFGAGVVFDGQIHQQIFRNGMVDEVAEFLGADFEVLRFGLPAINDGGHAPGGAQFPGPVPTRLRPGIRFQRH